MPHSADALPALKGEFLPSDLDGEFLCLHLHARCGFFRKRQMEFKDYYSVLNKREIAYTFAFYKVGDTCIRDIDIRMYVCLCVCTYLSRGRNCKKKCTAVYRGF